MTKEDLRTIGEVVLGTVVLFISALPPAVLTLLILQAMDVVTGLMAGYITRSLDSKVSYRGLMKKAMVLVAVAGSGYLGTALHLPADEMIPTAIAGFFSMHEGLSILENLVRADLPLPSVLKNAVGKGNVTYNDTREEERNSDRGIPNGGSG